MPRILITLIFVLITTLPSAAAEDPFRLLPRRICGTGWGLQGKVAVFGPETLSDRIDGEAEIFFPYGFEILSYGRYAKRENGFDVDVYRMGSTLDAFGMYASYRPEGADRVKAGTEGAVTSSQLFFYQDRYFVRLQSTGQTDVGAGVLAACARTVSELLPAGQGAPKEVELLAVPEVEKGSVQYKATSLLGYDFFPRGLMADAIVGGEPARVFVLLAGSPTEAAQALEKYRKYLQEGGGEVRSNGGGGPALSGIDPLYGNVVAEQAGSYLFGMVKVKDTKAALKVMKSLRLRMRR